MTEAEAEYLAAKDEYLVAQRRLAAAKAVWEPIRKAREDARRNAERRDELERLANAIVARSGGALLREANKIAGLKNISLYDLEGRFFRKVLPHDVLYNSDRDDESFDDWHRRMTDLALQRYHERIAA